MFGWVKKLFSSEDDHEPRQKRGYDFAFDLNKVSLIQQEMDDDMDNAEQGSVNIPISETGKKKRGRPRKNEVDMPSRVEQQDYVDQSQVMVVDQRTGREVPMSTQQAASMMEQVPPGVAVPGLGFVGGAKGHMPAPRQRQPQQQQQPQQPPPGYQPQYPQQQPYPPQQGYPQQPQGYPQQPYPAQGYPPMQNPGYVPPQPYPPQPYPQQPAYVQPQMPMQQQQAVDAPQPTIYPPTEIAMTSDSYFVFVDMPGVDKASIKITLEGDTLNVSAERISNIEKLRYQLCDGKEMKEGDEDPIPQARSTLNPSFMGEFKFSIPFTKQIDQTAISAQCDSGILFIRLPHRVVGNTVTVSLE